MRRVSEQGLKEAVEEEGKGEWGRRLEEWRERDDDLSKRLSEIPLDEEKGLSSEEQKEAIWQRRFEAGLDVIETVLSTPPMDSEKYFPGSKVLEATAVLFKNDRVKETVRDEFRKCGRELPERTINQIPEAIEEAKIFYLKRLRRALFKKASEEGRMREALCWGVWALLTGKVPEEQLGIDVRKWLGTRD